MAAVRLDEGRGLFLHEAHPSRVHPVLPVEGDATLRAKAELVVEDLGLDKHAAFVNVVYRALASVASHPRQRR